MKAKPLPILRSASSGHVADTAPVPLGRGELEARIRALELRGGVAAWLKIADDAARTLRAGNLGPTDMAIAVFDSRMARPTWEQCTGFVDAVLDCLCPEVRSMPDQHLVDRDVTVFEASLRSRPPKVTVEVLTPQQLRERS